MFEHGASLRSRLVVAFLATALFVVPAVAQTIIIGYNQCWLSCHKQGKVLYDDLKRIGGMTEGDMTRAANILFVNCMEENCGGM